MSSGTFIIESALTRIKAHSVVSNAPPEAITDGKHILNSMVAEWEDDGIKAGMVPLEVSSGELSEPLGIRQIVIDQLALRLLPNYPELSASNELIKSAARGMNKLERTYKSKVIPKPVARNTLPRGQGNSYPHTNPYFAEGEEVG